MAHLTSEAVDRIARDCTWPDAEVEGLSDEEIKAKSVVAEGILHTYAFRPEKIAEHDPELRLMVGDLPSEFIAASTGGGGGWSFLNLCMTADGEQWTGFHLMQERFLCLCIAAGIARILVPRELWEAMPGNVPYVVFSAEWNQS